MQHVYSLVQGLEAVLRQRVQNGNDHDKTNGEIQGIAISDANPNEGGSGEGDESGEHSGRQCQIGPVLLPVMGAQFLPGHFALEVVFKSAAVVRGKGLEVVGPRPDVAPVGVTKDSGHLGVAVASERQNLKVGFDLGHGASLNTLDHHVKPV